MYFELNVPITSPISQQLAPPQTSKKGKGKQPVVTNTVDVVYSPAQLAKIETRLDVLVRLGYTVIALNQLVESKVDPKTHVNILDPLLAVLRKRDGVLLLKRLTILLDAESEKGFGLTNANASLFTSYDIIALHCTTLSSFSLACLTHTLPSPLTAHVISLPSTSPRLPFNLKHTLIRTAIRNGAVFELCVAGAVKGSGGEGGAAGSDKEAESLRRNWWAASREVVRVTKGKGLIVSSGAENVGDLRAPKDAENLLCLLGLVQNLAHDAVSVTPKSLLIRAQTRKTYRAVFSEPKLVMPTKPSVPTAETREASATAIAEPHASSSMSGESSSAQANERSASETVTPATQPSVETASASPAVTNGVSHPQTNGKKRPREESELDDLPPKRPVPSQTSTPVTEPDPASSSNHGSAKKGKQKQEAPSESISNTKLPSKPPTKNSSSIEGSSLLTSSLPQTSQPPLWAESNSAKKRKKKKAKTGADGGEVYG